MKNNTRLQHAKTGNPYNILSAGMAGKLLSATKVTHSAIRTAGGVNALYAFGLRHCTVKGVRSGGMVVWVHINKSYEHGNYYNANKFSRRLPANPSFKRIAKALGRSWLEAQDAQQHRPARERLYLKINTTASAMDSTKLDLLCQAGEAAGHTIAYNEMSPEDCAYWAKALAA